MGVNNDLLYKLLKYLAMGIVIYLLFKFVPKAPMNDREILLVTVISVLLYATADNAAGLYLNKNASLRCSAECAMPKTSEHIEGMANIAKNIQDQGKNISNDVLNKLLKATAAPVDIPVHPTHVDTTKKEEPHKETEENKNSPHIDGMNGPDGSGSDLRFFNYLNSTLGDIYSDKNYKDLNNLPQFDITKDKYEYGYSFIPPVNWYPTPPHPPVCVTDNRCPVCPAFTTGLPADLKEWYTGDKHK